MRQNPVSKRAQSAMEYLMTYGWAILIISVVLGALFSLGVFSGSTLLGTSCIATPGYQCQSPSLLTTGVLTFTFGQNTGSTEYNAIIVVAPQGAALSTSGFPLAGTYNSGVYTTSGSFYNGNNLNSGSQVTFYTVLYSNAVTGGYSTLGNTFTGYVWVNYSTTSGGQPTVAVKAATLTAKVV